MKITVITGFGYFKDSQNNIISKAELPKGQHDLFDGLLYVEVANKETLDALEVYFYQDPEQLKLAADKAKIQEALEKLAIDQLKKDNYVFGSTEYKGK